MVSPLDAKASTFTSTATNETGPYSTKEIRMTDRLARFEMSGVLLVFATALALLLGGCATLDKDECLNADWQSIGYEDGARGYKTSRIANHRKACAKHGIAPDFDLYERGRLRGLEEWCTPRNGYRQGLGGKGYSGACPEQLEPTFLKGYTYGKDVRAYAATIQRQERDLKKMLTELDAMDQELAAMEDELVSPGVSPRRRRQLLGEIRQLEADQNLLINDINAMELALDDMQAHLNRLKSENPYQ
jgi:outer membrane murein-binding lipoprotein Lpp